MVSTRVPQTTPNMSCLSQTIDMNSRRHRVTTIWDLNSEVLILVSLEMTGVSVPVLLLPQLYLRLQNFNTSDVAGFHWTWTPLSNSLVSSSNVSDASAIAFTTPYEANYSSFLPYYHLPQSPQRIRYTGPYILLSLSFVLCLVPQAPSLG